MSENLIKYLNREIKNPVALAKLRDDAEFMLEVLRFTKKAREFDRVSDRLKEDENFINRVKEIFSDNSLEFFSLCISLRNYRKDKERREAEQDANRQKNIGKDGFKKREKKSIPEKVEKPVTISVQVALPTNGSIATTVNFETQIPLRVEKVKRASNVAECERTSYNKVDDEEVASFASLVNQLPVSKDERDLLVLMYRDASEEKKLRALLMVYDFVTFNGKKHPIKLLKSPSNNVYRFTEGF